MLRSLVPSIVRSRYAARLAAVLLVAVVAFSLVGYANLQRVDGTVQEVSATVEGVDVAVDRVSDTVRNDTEAQLRSTATLQARSIGNWIDRQKTMAGTLAGAGQLASGDTAAIRSYLNAQFERSSSSVRAIHYIDVVSREVEVSTHPNLAAADAPWRRATLGSGVWVSQTAYTVDGEQVLAFVSEVPTADRAVVVVASVEAKADRLYGSTDSAAASIVNGEGEIVTQDDASRLQGLRSGEGGTTVNRSALDAVQGGGSTFVTTGDRAFAYASIPESPESNVQGRRWVAVTSLSTEEAFAAANQAQAAAERTRAAAEQARATADAVTGSVLAIVAVALLALGGFGAAIGYQTIRPLSRLRDRAEKMENGDLDVDLETSREDEIGRLYDSFAAMRDSLKDRITEAESARREAESARQEAERSRQEVERLNEHLERKADHYSEVMNTCADGDLTARMDAESDNESMTEIAEAFNAMLDDIEATVVDVQAFAAAVATESEEVTASAEEVRNASQQVTESIQEISDGAADQDQRLQAVSDEMDSLSTTTEEIASSSNEVASIAERTAETGREGREAAEDAAEGMAEIRERSAAIVEAAEQLESEMAGVDELTEFIAGVAKETNMLALNANIEATRTGEEGGEGFAAVAEQVKEFAADTRDAAEEIEQRLDRIQHQADRTASEVRKSDAAIENNAESIENAIAALDDVAEFAQETNDGIQEISAATEEQASSVQEVVAMVDEVSTIGERTAEAAESVASAAEEQTAAMNDVSESASDLARQAAELSDALDRFSTADARGTTVDS